MSNWKLFAGQKPRASAQRPCLVAASHVPSARLARFCTAFASFLFTTGCAPAYRVQTSCVRVTIVASITTCGAYLCIDTAAIRPFVATSLTCTRKPHPCHPTADAGMARAKRVSCPRPGSCVLPKPAHSGELSRVSREKRQTCRQSSRLVTSYGAVMHVPFKAVKPHID